MSLSRGVIPATDADPCATFITAAGAAATTAGWTFVHQQTAAIMGTTGVVDVWAAPGTVLAAGIYTGGIVFLEHASSTSCVVRCAEVYDSTLTATPSSNVKWVVAANNSGTSTTVSALGGYLTDAFAQVTTGGTLTIAVANSPSYIVAADQYCMVVAANSSGAWRFAIAGKFAGYTDAGSLDSATCWLHGGGSTANQSWSVTSASGHAGMAKFSRAPLQATGVGVFSGQIWPSGSLEGTSTRGRPGTPNLYLQLVFYPAFVWVVTGQSWTFHRGNITGMACGQANNTVYNFGDVVTVDGVLYYYLGIVNFTAAFTDNHGLFISEAFA